MNSLNSLLIEGNLTRDPVLTFTPSGTPVANFTIATNRFYRHNDEMVKETSFFDVEAWSKLGEKVAELTKGRGVRVVGRIRQDRWHDAEGAPRARVKIVAEHVEIRPIFRKPGEEADVETADSVDAERVTAE